MIRFCFEIAVPRKHTFDSYDIFLWEEMITTNKGFCFQLNKWSRHFVIIHFDFYWRSAGDHAGLSLDLGLLGYSLYMNLYDKRHWNYIENRFMTEKEVQEEYDEWEASRKK